IVKPDFLRGSKTKSMSVQELATYPIAATHPTYGTRQMLQAVERILLRGQGGNCRWLRTRCCS
ncbi:MAG: hypothetical protein QOJ04_4332, partial [Caballeronia sp.]|nr:hypothetical protein [Caballeronia sp.]